MFFGSLKSYRGEVPCTDRFRPLGYRFRCHDIPLSLWIQAMTELDIVSGVLLLRNLSPLHTYIQLGVGFFIGFINTEK